MNCVRHGACLRHVVDRSDFDVLADDPCSEAQSTGISNDKRPTVKLDIGTRQCLDDDLGANARGITHRDGDKWKGLGQERTSAWC